MPDDPTVVGGDLNEAVRAIIAHVLMVNIGDVQPDRALIADLSAESIDFLDLVFRIEDAVGKKIELTEWQEFVIERLPGTDLSRTITVAIVQEFAHRQARR
jgi:acyl carrier protein